MVDMPRVVGKSCPGRATRWPISCFPTASPVPLVESWGEPGVGVGAFTVDVETIVHSWDHRTGVLNIVDGIIETNINKWRAVCLGFLDAVSHSHAQLFANGI